MTIRQPGKTSLAAKTSDRVRELEKLIATISRGKMQWEHTFDVITDPVTIIDREYHILRANKSLAKASDMDVRQVIGKKCHVIFAGYSSPCPRCPVEKTLADRQSHSVELEPFPKKRRQYHASVYSLPQPIGDTDEIVLHYRDVTDEKNLQRQLMQTDKMAAIGTLAGGVAHEINNPLGAILAFAQLALREIREGQPCHEYLTEIEEATLRCKKIVRDLLDFSRQNFDERMQELELNEAVEKALTLIQVNARDCQVTVVRRFAEDLPRMQGHIHKLQQIVMNLVTNAMHAMKDGGGVCTLATSCSPDRRSVMLDVEDTGGGIAEDDLVKIFDPYFTTKEQGEGTGLGLSICYKIVREHQGTIEVDSGRGRGTKFRLRFPVARVCEGESVGQSEDNVEAAKITPVSRRSGGFVTNKKRREAR